MNGTEREQELKKWLESQSSSSQNQGGNLQDSSQKPLAIELEQQPLDIPVERMPEGKKKIRHTIQTCKDANCEKCKAKRIELARSWGYQTSQDIPQEKLDWLDEKICGEILMMFHTHRHEKFVIQGNSELAKVWEVQKDRQEKMGEAGYHIFNKYMSQATFKYKEEMLLGAWWTLDLGLRLNAERQIKTLLKLSQRDGFPKPKQ